MTIRLETAPELEGVPLFTGTVLSQGEMGFEQLLDALAHAPTDTLVSKDGSPAQQNGQSINTTGNVAGDATALLTAFIPAMSAPSPADTPALLEGGRETAGESGRPLPSMPPPLPLPPLPASSTPASVVSNLNVQVDGENPNKDARYIAFLNDNHEKALDMQSAKQIAATLWQEPVNKNPVDELVSPATPQTMPPSLESERLFMPHRDNLMETEQQVESVQHRESSFAPHEHPAPFPAPLQPLHHATGGFLLHESTALSEAPLYQQVADVLERLVIYREERTVHLQLEPPELGTLQIRIHVEGSEVHAWLAAERDLTRQSLEQQAQQLREQLAARGLQLAHFEVSTGSQGAFGGRWFDLPSSLPSPETPSRRVHATDSLNLFGQWSAWA